MKRNFTYLGILGLLFVLFSCKKEPIDEPIADEEPVFYATGSLGSESFSVTAGNENYYMQSSSEIKNGVKYFSGKLTNSDFEMTMGIFDGNIDHALPVFVNSLPNDLQFASIPSYPLAILSKDNFPNSQLINQIDWFVDGAFAGTNDIDLTEPGKYAVCATVYFFDGSQANVCNDLILGYERDVKSQLRHYLSQDGVLQTWIESDNFELVQATWSIDGVVVSNDIKLTTNIDQQSHVITADLLFENGTRRKKSIVIDGALNGRFVDDFSVFENLVTDFIQDYNVTISLKKNGKLYRSDITTNDNSTLDIDQISYFGLNSAGNPVFKVVANIDCKLKDVGTGDILPFTCTTVFGIEVK